MRGVYAIMCTDGRAYVGGSMRIPTRWKEHRCELSLGKHGNRLLQQAWNEMGEAAFAFTVLEVVPSGDDLVSAEQRHMDRLRAERELFNLAPLAGTSTGVVLSDETRAKMSRTWKARCSDPDVRERMSLAQKGVQAGEKHPNAKLTEAKVIEIRRLSADGVTQREIAARFGVTREAVSRVVRRENWPHVLDHRAAA